MPTHTLEDELYHKYDMVVGEILKEIMKTVDENKTIRLLQFDSKDKEHLLVLRVALMAKELFYVSVETDLNWRERFVLNWKIRKSFNKIGKVPKSITTGVWVPHVLDIVRIKNNYGFDFGDIYKTYYEGSLD